MSTEPQPDQDRDELSLLEIIRILLQKKNRILGLTILAGTLLAAGTLLLENTYESTAALIVRNPELEIRGEPSPMTISMVQALAESHEIKTRVYRQLRAERRLPPELGIKKFQNRLSSTVKKEVSRDLALQPMIQLHARAPEPELAKTIANAWTDLITTHSRTAYAGGVTELKKYTTRMYERTDRALKNADDAYTSAMLQAGLSAKQTQLGEMVNVYGKLSANLLTLEDATKTSQTLFRESAERLAALDRDGVWFGEYYQELLDQNSSAALEISPTTATARIISTINNLTRKERELANFEAESQLQFLRLQLQSKEHELQRIAQGIDQTNDQLSRLEANQAALTASMKELEPKISLRRALSDEVIYEGLAKNWIENFKALPALESEELNPNFFEISGRVIAQNAELQGLRQNLNYLTAQRETLKGEIGQLAAQILNQTTRRERLSDSLARDRNTLNFLREEYRRLQEQHELLRQEFFAGLAVQQVKSGQLANLTRRMEDLDDDVIQHQNNITALGRYVSQMTLALDALTSKTHEVTLLEIAAQQASRSGLQLLYRAEVNPDKVAPARGIICLIGMLAALIVISTVFVISSQLQSESPKSDAARPPGG